MVTDKGAALCQPSERVFELLDNLVNCFTKEEGEVVQSAKDKTSDTIIETFIAV